MKHLFFILFLPFYALAQDYTSLGDAPKKALDAYDDATYQLREKAFDKAEAALLKALKIAPNFIDAHFQLAELYYTKKRFDEAQVAYQRCVRLSPQYKPQALFTLGLIQEQQKNWAKAAEYYDSFLKLRRDPELIKKATRQAEYCRFRANAYANPVPFEPKNLGKSINSVHDEYLPSLSLDAQSLIYTVHIDNKNEEFFKATLQNNTWLPAQNMGAPLNTLKNEGAQTISANGKTIVFSACNRPDGLGACDFYISDYINGEWTAPKNIGAPINTRYWDGHASLSADGRLLYLSSDRKEGNGGEEDIFVASRNDDGTWNTPQPLPLIINTPYGERSPFIHPDGRTLYFSSSGHAGMGRSDIFRTQKNDDGKWSKPINLGYPINTMGADWSLIVAPNGKTAIYSAQRPDGEGGMDLYQFELPDYAQAIPTTFVRGVVKDAKTNQIIRNAKCDLVDLATQKMVISVQTDSEGAFLVPLPTQKHYGMTIRHSGYAFFSDNFALEGMFNAEKPFEKLVFLQKITTDSIQSMPNTPKNPEKIVQKPIVLKNIFFKTNSSDLLPESLYELQELLALLQTNPDLHIQINGHTDSQGDTANNQSLSERRAQAVVTYLINNRIESQRLTSKGFGESQPIDTNDTPEGRANNRRTEFLIITR